MILLRTRPLASFASVLALSQALCAQVTPPSTTAQTGYALLGSGIGVSRLALVHAGGVVEIATSSGSVGGVWGGAFWFTLRFDSQLGTYQQSFVSRSYAPQSIVRTLAADMLGDSNEEIVVGLSNGQILIADGQSHATLATVNTPAGTLTALTTADVNGDGATDLLAVVGSTLYAYAVNGTQLWSVSGPNGYDVIAAQMDGDPGLEVATTSGHVIDARTHTLQWFRSGGFGVALEAGDFDNDGMAELVAAEQWSFIRAYDVDTQVQKWSIPIFNTLSLEMLDLDGNGTLELMIGEAQWGEVRIFDPATQVQLDHIPNPEHGVTTVTAGDVDGDGATEILWSAGYTSSGEDHLYIVDRVTHALAYESPDLVGPLLGVQRGDLDGDGLDELVTCTAFSDSGYSSGRILVFDAATLRLRGMSAGVSGNFCWTGVHDLQLANVDSDPQLEILVAGDRLYDGVIEIYDFSPSNSFSLTWTNATRPAGSPFYSVAVADIDGDGNLEVVGGVGIATSGSLGVFVYAYDLATHAEEWHSPNQGGSPISHVELADTDQDGVIEIVALNRGTGSVHVFDGATKVQEALLTGTFTSLGLIDLGPTPATPRPLVLGDASGHVSVYRHNAGVYQLTAQGTLATTTIDRAQAVRRNVFVQAGGTIRQHFALNPTPLWQSQPYGSVPGNSVVYSPNGPFVIVAAGTYGLFGF